MFHKYFLDFQISRYQHIFVKTNVKKAEKTDSFTTSFFTPDDNIKRRERLTNENWDVLYELTDPDAIYDCLQEIYGKHYNETKTTKTCKKGSNRFRREPWMTVELLAEMRKRDRLAKIKDRRADYKKIRNEIVAKSRKARKEYIS